MMNETRQPTTTLEDQRIPVRVKLAAAWTSFMFLYIYVDYLALYKPGFVDDILAGIVHEFDIGPTFLGIGLTLIAIPDRKSTRLNSSHANISYAVFCLKKKKIQ